MIFLLQEWEATKSNHLIRDTIRTKKVTNSFRYQKDDLQNDYGMYKQGTKIVIYHCWKNVSQGPSELKHYNNNRYGDSHHPTKKENVRTQVKNHVMILLQTSGPPQRPRKRTYQV
jgi:hypothetical protein